MCVWKGSLPAQPRPDKQHNGYSLGDALAVALMKVRDFKPRDFAQFPSAGSLGKRLLQRLKTLCALTTYPYLHAT